MLQFLKSYGSSEHNVKIDNLTIETVEEKVKFVFNMTDEEKEENRLNNERRFLDVVEQCKNDGTGLLVLDEVIGAVFMEQISEELIVDFLKNKPEGLEVVMTGRDAPESFVELADYVSEIRKVKHPFDKGAMARKGIEF
jgi:cob(I)alamin adenosyltransferase